MPTSPSADAEHPAMGAVLLLIQENNVTPDQVEKVDVGTNHNMPNALIYHRPQTGLEGQFSMEFCVAILILERRAVLGQFTDATVKRPDVQGMIRPDKFLCGSGSRSRRLRQNDFTDQDSFERWPDTFRTRRFRQR